MKCFSDKEHCSVSRQWILLYVIEDCHPASEDSGHQNCRNPIPNIQDSAHSMRIHAAMLQQLKEQCDKKNEELETKRRRGKEIEEALENSPCQISEERLGLLDLPQLKHLKQMMEKLRENVRLLATAPQLNSVEPLASTNADEPLIPEKVDLANVEKNGRDASPIPSDWLKL